MSTPKSLFSGIQPSGKLTLGNYLGAIKHWVGSQSKYACKFCIVDLHAITVNQNPKDLYQQTLDTLAILLACGIDPKKSIVFLQSTVMEHAQLAWLLNCQTFMGELQRMTQFKDKSKQKKNLSVGLFTYPCLQAADILLYDTELVPVGADQKQHIELCRDLANRFNHLYGDTLLIPEPLIPVTGSRIMSLQDPFAKMSKSDLNTNSFISLIDTDTSISKKLKKAVTDSENTIAYHKDKQPGVSNLLTIIHALTGQDMHQLISKLEGLGYGALKNAAIDAVIAMIQPIRDNYTQIRSDEQYLADVIATGKNQASKVAKTNMQKISKAMGIHYI